MRFIKVIFEKKDGIGFINLNDPAVRHAFTDSLRDELMECMDDCASDPDVRAVVLRGTEGNFSAGGNIKEFKEIFASGVKPDYDAMVRKYGVLVSKVRNIRKPVIASLNGSVMGGGLSLALVCDFRIAAEDALFALAFVNMGFVPDMGGAFTLIKMAGWARATELMMTGKPFSGKDAFEWGLVNEAVPAEQLAEATMKLANKLAKGPTLAYGAMKTMVNRVAFGGLDLHIDTEAEYQQMMSLTEDHREGVHAFLEKRKPAYKGR